MDQPQLESFLDVHQLLEQPRSRGPRWIWLAGFLGLAMVLIAFFSGGLLQADSRLLDALGGVAVIVLILSMGLTLRWLARSIQRQQQDLEAVEELIQLRRWVQAAGMLQDLFHRPLRSSPMRAQALIYLAAILTRYHRYADAAAVYDHLMSLDFADPSANLALRVGRAMVLLHEDRLLDVDRAINEIRRMPGGEKAAGLAMVQMYRDVKTGHPQEALEIFEAHLPAFRDQLGHRLADAYALAARAQDMLGKSAEAQAAYDAATHLLPPEELAQRYPEVVPLLDRYAPAKWPKEAA